MGISWDHPSLSGHGGSFPWTCHWKLPWSSLSCVPPSCLFRQAAATSVAYWPQDLCPCLSCSMRWSQSWPPTWQGLGQSPTSISPLVSPTSSASAIPQNPGPGAPLKVARSETERTLAAKSTWALDRVCWQSVRARFHGYLHWVIVYQVMKAS